VIPYIQVQRQLLYYSKESLLVPVFEPGGWQLLYSFAPVLQILAGCVGLAVDPIEKTWFENSQIEFQLSNQEKKIKLYFINKLANSTGS
jgi:hypothetical protein